MAVPPRVTPRRAEPTDLMKVTPSGRVNFQGQSVGAPPQVRASSAVQQPTPYIGKPAPRTDLLTLAEGLQYFNGEIGKLAYTQRQQWEESQVEKGKTDAITDPAKVAEVFRVGLDAATEQGLFPKYAHPKYRMAYMEQGAQNMALTGLPAFLEEKAKGLTAAGSTEPIDATLNASVDEFAASSGLADNPLAYAAFRKSAFQTVFRVSAETRAKKEQNFNEARVEGLGQTVSGLTTSLLKSYEVDNPRDRRLAADASYRDLQTFYDSLKVDFPEVDATKEFTSAFLASLNGSVTSQEITPTEAIAVIEDAKTILKSGTGSWADISDVQQSISGMIMSWSNQSANLENKNKQKVNEQNEMWEAGVKDAFQSAKDNDTFTSLNTTTDMDSIAQQVSEATGYVLSPEEARRKVRELRVEFAETEEKEEKIFLKSPYIAELIEQSPEGALVFIRNQYKNGDITKATFEEYEKKAREAADVVKFMDEGGFAKKLADMEGMARDAVAPKGIEAIIGGQDPLTDEEANKIYEMQTFGENTFRDVATELVRQKLSQDPELRESADTARRAQVMQQAVNEAFVETSKRMRDYTSTLDQKAATEGGTPPETYGPSTRKVKLIEDAVNNVRNQAIPTPQNIDYKLRIHNAQQDLRELASQMGRATDAERPALLASYNKILALTGYGPKAVIDGETEDGIPVDVSKINPKTTPIFRNENEFNAVVDEAVKAASQPVATGENYLVSFVKEAEGFYEKAYWDNSQWSIGYGTRSYQGEVITREAAAQRLNEELASHAKRIDAAQEKSGILLSEGQRNALISFDYNTGKGVSVIERFAGDPAAMKKKMMEYDQSQGHINRRLKEVAMFDSEGSFATPSAPYSETTYYKLLTAFGLDLENSSPENIEKIKDFKKEFERNQRILSKERSL